MRSLHLTVLFLLACCTPTLAQYEERQICGWTLHVHTGLNKDEVAQAMPLLRGQLEEITRVVPPAAVTALRRVHLWFSPPYPGTPPRAEYHPGAEWLRQNGRNPAMARAVEFTNVSLFEEECRRMPNFTLHELAHAYHHQVLGHDYAAILGAFAAATAGGTYQKVERKDAKGRRWMGKAYALTNEKEYFAECTEAFFSKNDFFPYDRRELQKHDPGAVAALEAAWGVSGD